jgi:hypothetical protein
VHGIIPWKSALVQHGTKRRGVRSQNGGTVRNLHLDG